MTVTYIFAAIFILVALLHIFFPQLLWRKTAAWQFRNPQAVESSKAGYLLQRIGGVFILIVGLIILFSPHK